MLYTIKEYTLCTFTMVFLSLYFKNSLTSYLVNITFKKQKIIPLPWLISKAFDINWRKYKSPIEHW